MTNIYIDIDSTYRNRDDYPNPADFVVIPKQDNLPTAISLKNPCSNQIILYPQFGTPPLYFTRDTLGHVVEHTNLPYMYRTNDPHIIQLDELSINPTVLDDIGKTIVTDLYPRGSVPLGEANQFYTGDYLENMATGEIREITSFSFETGSDFVFQSSQVLWSTLIGDTFKIGVERLSSLTIPPSNIYNLYRGKYLKIITGQASGFRSLIVDYRQESETLSVFTLNSFSGVLPAQGDTFQIVSDRRWYATVETPFEGLSAYPGYEEPLPITELRFTSNVIFEARNAFNPIPALALNESNDVLIMNQTGFLLGYEEYRYTLLNSLDAQNYFWDTPSPITQSVEYSDCNYTTNALGNITYQMELLNEVNFSATEWSISATVVLSSGLTLYYGNILGTTYPLRYNYTLQGQIHALSTTNHDIISYVYYSEESSQYRVNVAWRVNGTVSTMNIFQVLSTSSVTDSILIHDMKEWNGVVYLYVSLFTGFNLTYYMIRINNVSSSSHVVRTVQSFTSINRFVHYIRRLRMTEVVSGSQRILVCPLIEFHDDQFFYTLNVSYTQGDSWLYLQTDQEHVHILELGTTVDANIVRETGIVCYALGGRVYTFVWGNAGFLYNSFDQTEIAVSPPPAVTDVTVTALTELTTVTRIQDVVVSTENNVFFIVYTYINDDNHSEVVSLNTQQFVVSEAVPYRIRKGPTSERSERLPYTSQILVQPFAKERATYPVVTTESQRMAYSESLNTWLLSSNGRLYISPDWGEHTSSVEWLYTGRAYTVTTVSVFRANAVFFRSDGTKMIVLTYTNSTDRFLLSYTLAFPWEVSTAVYDGKMVNIGALSGSLLDVQDIYVHSDGVQVWALRRNTPCVFAFAMTTAWDILTLTYTGNFYFLTVGSSATGMDFSPDGMHLYISDKGTDEIYQLDLGVAWDITTAVETGSYYIGLREDEVGAIQVAPDGTRLWIVDEVRNCVCEYAMGIPWNIETLSYTQEVDVYLPETTRTSIRFRADLTRFYLLTSTGRIYMYSNALPSSTVWEYLDSRTLAWSTTSFTYLWSTTDFETWNIHTLPFANTVWNAFYRDDEVWVVQTTTGTMYYSSDGVQWVQRTQPAPVLFQQFLRVDDWLVGLPTTGDSVYYTAFPLAISGVWAPWILSGGTVYTFRGMTWSPLLEMLVVSTDTVDFIRTRDFITWTPAYRSYASTIRNHVLYWDTYYEAFWALSEVDGHSVVYFSKEGETWVNTTFSESIVTMASFKERFVTGSVNSIDESIWDVWMQTNRYPSTKTDLLYSYLWIYNKPIADNLNYEVYNDVYQLIEYDTVRQEYITSKTISVQLPYKTFFEILADIEDMFNGVNIPFQYEGDRCYSIAIHDIILPNKVIRTYLGNQISFYPYIYIRVSNEGAGSSSMYNIVTNNPNATTLTFKIPVSQFTNDPSALPYIQLSSGMVVKSKFNLKMPFRFSVFLPNGDLFETVETDNIIPDFPNPLLQISATLRITL